MLLFIRASTLKLLSSVVCEQGRRRPARASAQSNQRLCYSLIDNYRISKLATIEISIFKLIPVAEDAGLNLTLSFIESKHI